jgi:Pvc16 N-terminal domain
MSCAAAVDRIRALITRALPPELHTATVSIGHPGSPEEYALAVSLYVLQIREDVLARTQPGQPRPTVIEAPLLVAAHAPPERGFDGVHLLELAIGVIRANPHLGQVTPHATAELALHVATLEEMASLWRALGTPLQPSVLCTLRVVTNAHGRPEAPGTGML